MLELVVRVMFAGTVAGLAAGSLVAFSFALAGLGWQLVGWATPALPVSVDPGPGRDADPELVAAELDDEIARSGSRMAAVVYVRGVPFRAYYAKRERTWILAYGQVTSVHADGDGLHAGIVAGVRDLNRVTRLAAGVQ